MNRQEKRQSNALGIYLHVPFCATNCDFCAFYQKEPKRQDLDRYLAAMEKELSLFPPDRAVETVFWGGGTPGLLPARDLERLGHAMLERLSGPPREWTIEMAPSTVKPDKIRVMKDMGVTRISMGVQTFQEKTLEVLGRTHSPKQVYKAIDIIRNEEFENLNLDLIFAIPGQRWEDWEQDLREVFAISPEHLSTYCLTFEDDTALWAKMVKGQLKPLGEEESADFYARTWDALELAGYPQYEISNFSRPGRECLHNINTWRMYDWIGYGPSASSQWDGRRYTNIHDLSRWIEGIEKEKPNRIDEVKLNDDILATDAFIFGLRMNAGVDVAEIASRFPDVSLDPLLQSLEQLREENLAEMQSGTTWRLSKEGRMLGDRIGTHLLEVME